MNEDLKVGVRVYLPMYTETKLFCSCKSTEGESDTLVCPVCMGAPGAYPSLNRSAVIIGTLAAMLLDCTINTTVSFERKLCDPVLSPKGYKITQLSNPLGVSGSFFYGKNDSKKVDILSVYIEEEVRRDIEVTDEKDADFDYNRCGRPFLVVESGMNFSSGAEVHEYLNKLYTLLHYFSVTPCKHEEDNVYMKLYILIKDENIKSKGSIVGLFASPSLAETAVEFELGRQLGLLEYNLPVEFQALRYDKEAQTTVPMRNLEDEIRILIQDAEIPDVHIEDDMLDSIAALIEERPNERSLRYHRNIGIPLEYAEVICREKPFVRLFDEASKMSGFANECAYYIAVVLTDVIKRNSMPIKAVNISVKKFSTLVFLVHNRMISDNDAKILLEQMLLNDVEPYEFASRNGMFLIEDETTITIACKMAMNSHVSLLRGYLDGSKEDFEHLLDRTISERLSNRADRRTVGEILKGLATRENLDLIEKYAFVKKGDAMEVRSEIETSRLINKVNDTQVDDLSNYSEQILTQTPTEINSRVESIIEKVLSETETPDVESIKTEVTPVEREEVEIVEPPRIGFFLDLDVDKFITDGDENSLESRFEKKVSDFRDDGQINIDVNMDVNVEDDDALVKELFDLTSKQQMTDYRESLPDAGEIDIEQLLEDVERMNNGEDIR